MAMRAPGVRKKYGEGPAYQPWTRVDEPPDDVGNVLAAISQNPKGFFGYTRQVVLLFAAKALAKNVSDPQEAPEIFRQHIVDTERGKRKQKMFP